MSRRSATIHLARATLLLDTVGTAGPALSQLYGMAPLWNRYYRGAFHKSRNLLGESAKHG